MSETNKPAASEKEVRGLFDPDFCETRCPFCTRARQGNRFARFRRAIEALATLGGCPWGRARRRKYGLKPHEPLPPQDG